ncbi:hypothetical protein [Agromyces aerolatus]|uniref:hypothetical protein n=1 Tax=Agromyces sp. LY-1074 TaxID=3074080 RepID=UPI0028545978|nr:MULTISPECIES: hypothetical protein [unclassified Agromyces]MDR5699161.1 hypothetical protein [Agromyces sp. LY-1074]MDR5705456.1 hypothetical protein [Agromyces sp. LY-1358]
MRNERSARVARGSAIALFATFTASLAHTLGGGMPPGLLTLALALAFSVPFAVVAVGRRTGLARAGVAALGAQLALHALYSLGTTGATATALTDASGRALSPHAHAHHHVPAGLPASGDAATALAVPGGEAAAGAVAHAAHPGVWMVVTHAAAAVLTIAFIAGADRVLAAVAASARGIRVALVLTRAPLAIRRAPARPAPVGVRPIRAARDRHLLATPRRGPPVVIAAA